MCREYKTLSSDDKAVITRLLNARKALDEAQARYNNAVDKAMDAIRFNEAITKGYARISYIAPTTYTTLDGARLKSERPDVYAQYTKTGNRKEGVRVIL